jgi:hypothetical protein
MAIIIPSKNIYGEYTHTQLAQNQVDSIKVGAYEIETQKFVSEYDSSGQPKVSFSYSPKEVVGFDLSVTSPKTSISIPASDFLRNGTYFDYMFTATVFSVIYDSNRETYEISLHIKDVPSPPLWAYMPLYLSIGNEIFYPNQFNWNIDVEKRIDILNVTETQYANMKSPTMGSNIVDIKYSVESSEQRARNIYYNWQYGKETITGLTCNFDNYYRYKNPIYWRKVVSALPYPEKSNSPVSFEFEFDTPFSNSLGKIKFLGKRDGKFVHITGGELQATSDHKKIILTFSDAKKTFYSSGIISSALYTALFFVFDGTEVEGNPQTIIDIDDTQFISNGTEAIVMKRVYDESTGEQKDIPISTYSDGTPKIFKVINSYFVYDGAFYQKFDLQEVTQKKEYVYEFTG